MLDIRSMPLFIPALGWVLGLALARMDAVPWQVDAGFLLVFLLSVAVRWHRLFYLWAILGLLWGAWGLLDDARQINYSPDWVGHAITLQAKVDGVRIQSGFARLRLKHVKREDGATLAGNIDVYVWGKQELPKQGQQVTLTAKLHAPRNHQNPGGFDYVGYCFAHHIALMGGVIGNIETIDHHQSLLQSWRHRIQAVLPIGQNHHAENGVLQVLLLAKRDAIPIAIQDAFAATGAAHLLAISGLHMGMVAAWGALCCWWILTRREAWIVRFPIRYYAMLFGLLTAMAYATIAGWPLPAQRAGWMLAAAVLAWWLRARYQPINILLAALMLILWLDSAAILSISLWLSFIATLALLLFAGGQNQSKGYRVWAYIKALLGVSLIAGLATLPLITAVFERFPVWSLVANFVLLPLYAFWILPLALLGECLALLGLSAWAKVWMLYAGNGIAWGNQWLLYLHQLPGGNLWLPQVQMIWTLFYMALMIIVAVVWFKQKRAVAVSIMVLGILLYAWHVVPERAPKQAQFIVWDVGQGAASTLVQPNSNGESNVLVVDVSGRVGSRFNGGTTVASGLRALGLTHVDVLMLSHAQADHAGGALRLLDSERAVSELWLADVPANHAYATMKEAIYRIQAQGGKVRWLKQGDMLHLGDASVHVLWPPQGYAPDNDNNTSLICSIRLSDGRAILVSGDMEAPVEQTLLRQHSLTPHDMMLMPHHGSRTSSTDAMLKAVQPKYVVVQTGVGNRFGFPKQDIVQRYQHIGSQVWDTSQGAVIWYLSDKPDAWVQYKVHLHQKRDVALQWVKLLI